jgi:hypothetical protein
MPTTCTASGPIVKGDAVCLSAWDTGAATNRPIVSRATAANLAALKTVFGVAKGDAVDAGAVDVLVAGEVADQSITSLSSGLSASRLVVTKYSLGDSNREAELRYIYDTTGEADDPPVFDAVAERYLVGTSDENGNLAIQPRHSSDETGFPKVYNMKAYGGVPDYDFFAGKGTDNLPAFNRALAAMRVDGNVGAKLVADGRFYFSDTLVLNQTIVFEGTSMNEPGVDIPGSPLKRSSPGTWLIFPAINAKGARVPGIRIHGGALGEVDNPKVGEAADKTSLRNLTIFCKVADGDMVPEGADATSHGVHASTAFSAENVTVEFFAGDGFHLMGYYRDPANPDVLLGGSVDGAVVRNCVVGSCGRDGFHLEGGDATACVIDGCYAAGNRRYGFFDATRQNTYLGCLAYVNGAPGIRLPAPGETGSEYHTEGETNTSTFIGCYAEGGDVNDIRYHPSQFYGPVTIIGGTIGANYISEDSTCFILEGAGRASRAPLIYENTRAATLVNLEFGQQDALCGVLNFVLPNFPDPNVIRYNEATGWWGLNNSSSHDRTCLRFPTQVAAPRQPAPLFEHGIFYGTPTSLGDPGASRAITNHSSGTGVPTGGTWEVGDVVWNRAAVPGGPVGWVCTVAGTEDAALAGVHLTADAGDTSSVTVNDVSTLTQWQYITFAGERYQITNDPGHASPVGSVAIYPSAVGGLNGDSVQFSRTNFSAVGPVENFGISQSHSGAHNLLQTERYVTGTATATITLPNSPVDGQTYSIKSRVNVAAPVTTTVNALGGLLIDGTATATVAPGNCRTFRYSASEGQWEVR